MMIVSIGSDGGAGQLPTKSGMVIGATLAKFMKSKTLFTSRYWGILNQKVDWKDPLLDTTIPAEEIRKKNLAAALSTSEEEAKDLLQEALPFVEREEGESNT